MDPGPNWRFGTIANNTPNPRKVPQKNGPSLDTGNYKVFGSSQLDYTSVAHQERETSELTFRLLPKAKMVSLPKDQ